MDSPFAEVANVLADVAGSNPSTGAYRYYVTDHLGSTRGLYDGGKSALGGYEYTPYGEVYASSGSVGLDGLAAAFTGKPWDAAAQMYSFPYRWYSPSAARWLVRDPLGMVDGPNVYGYVRGKPVNHSDPMGLFIWKFVQCLRWMVKLKECGKKQCTDELATMTDEEFMEKYGGGYIDDAILNCMGVKCPKEWKKVKKYCGKTCTEVRPKPTTSL